MTELKRYESAIDHGAKEMKQRKFIRSNTEKSGLIKEIDRLKRTILSQERMTKYLKSKDPRQYIYMICSSYESGFGHGLAEDGLDLSKTPHAEEELGIAYQIGYEAGLERNQELW